jgi:hypothetical protein
VSVRRWQDWEPRINWLDERGCQTTPPATTRNNMKQIIAHVLRCRCCPRHWHSQYGPLVQVTQVVEAVDAVPLNSKPGAQSATASGQRSMRVRLKSVRWSAHAEVMGGCAMLLCLFGVHLSCVLPAARTVVLCCNDSRQRTWIHLHSTCDLTHRRSSERQSQSDAGANQLYRWSRQSLFSWCP